MRLAIAVLASLAVASLAQAQNDACASSTGRRVQTTGSAQIRTAPDRVTFTVGVSTEAPGVAQAFAANGARSQAVIAALKAKGVAAKEVQTSNLDVQPVTSDDGRKTIGYRVSNQVTVTREDTASAGELLQAAIEAGANNANGLAFFVADASKSHGKGLELAFQEAKAKASALAGAAGLTLGEAVCLNENSAMQAGVFSNMAMNAKALGAPIESGSEVLNYSVYATFELKAR